VDFNIGNDPVYTFLIDTGFQGIAIDQSFEQLPFLSKENIFRNNLNFKNGDFSKNIRFIRFNNIKTFSGDFCDGIIGPDFFSDYLIEFDYSNKVINLYAQNHVIDKDFAKVAIRYIRNPHYIYGLFLTELEIFLPNGAIIKGELAIDTGNGGSITLFDASLQRVIENRAIEKVEWQTHILNESYQLKDPIYLKAGKIVFNNKSYEKLIVDYLKSDTKEEFIGAIGGGFLKNFTLLMDYKNKFLYIKEKNNPEFQTHLITNGLGYRDCRKIQMGFMVSKKIIDSKYFNLDINLEDEIIKIDGVEVSTIDFEKSVQEKTIIGNKIKYTLKRNNREFEVETEVMSLF
jgi:predicted aspartyl protease